MPSEALASEVSRGVTVLAFAKKSGAPADVIAALEQASTRGRDVRATADKSQVQTCEAADAGTAELEAILSRVPRFEEVQACLAAHPLPSPVMRISDAAAPGVADFARRVRQRQAEPLYIALRQGASVGVGVCPYFRGP